MLEKANKPCPKCEVRVYHNMWLCPTKEKEVQEAKKKEREGKKGRSWADASEWKD